MPKDNPSVGSRFLSAALASLRSLHGIISGSVSSAPIAFLLVMVGVSGAFSAFTRTRVYAQTPNTTINYQARIMNFDGSLVADGDYNVEFKLYTSETVSGTPDQGACTKNSGTADTTCLWVETRTGSDRVRVVNGYVSANLGSVTSFPSNMPWGTNLYVTMRVGGKNVTPTWDTEMTNATSGKRMKITAVPLAFAANNVLTGDTNASSTNSDNISIQTGDALGTTSNSGSITIDSGTATGTAGSIALGTGNASALTIGRAGVTTTLQGSVSLTGSGTALSVTNDATIGGTLTVTGVTTATGGLTVGTGTNFINQGSTLNTAVSVSDKPTGGNIGTAASTVDAYTTFNVNQTTAGQTLTLASPTDTTSGRIVYVNNVGSVSMTMYGSVIASGKSNAFIWNGSSWVTTVSLSGSVVNTVGTIDSVSKSADGASISSNAIYLQTADATYPGLISTGTQSFAGNKTFTGTVTVSGATTLSSTLAVSGDSTLSGNVVIAASKSLTVTGGNTASRPASPTEGMIYFDTTTKQLLTYANGKWQGDRSTATKIVAASNSSQAIKDAADYVATGTSDQTIINTALTSATGGKVYLAEGTYYTTDSISIPNDTTLAGSGYGTQIQFANLSGASKKMIVQTAQYPVNINVRDLYLNGRKDINTTGTQTGIGIDSLSIGSFQNIRASNFSGSGIYVGYPVTSVTISNSYVDNNDIGISSSYDFSGEPTKIVGNQAYNNNTGFYGGGAWTGNSASTNVTGFNIGAGVASGNDVYNNSSYGFVLGQYGPSTLTGNRIVSNPVGVSVNETSKSTISGNIINGSTTNGIQLTGYSSNNTVSGNTISDSGGATANNGISVSGNNDLIESNIITDSSCTTTCYAISIIGTKNYLSGNRYSGSTADAASINDLGTNTIYDNQQVNATTSTNSDITDFRLRGSANSTTAFSVQNASAGSILNIDTTNGEVELGDSATAGKLVVSDGSSNTATLVFAASSADVTFQLPAASAGTYDICTTASVCSGYQAAGSYLTASLTDNIADAFDLQEGTNNYFNINTTDGSEEIQFGNTTTNPAYTFLGTGTLSVEGALHVLSGATIDGTTTTDDAVINNSLTVYNGSSLNGATLFGYDTPASSAVALSGGLIVEDPTSAPLGYAGADIYSDIYSNANAQDFSTINAVGVRASSVLGAASTDVFSLIGVESSAGLVYTATGSSAVNAVAFHAQDSIITAGSITNGYGLFVDNQSGATNNYGVYIQGASTYALFVDSGATRLDGDLAVDSTTLVVNSTSDYVNIGSSTDESARFAVVGANNETQLLVRASGSQTVANPLVVLQDSTTAELARINATSTSLYFGNAAGGNSAAGVNNTGIGASALGSVSTGTGNTTLGSGALASVSSGTNNTAVGYNAGTLSTGSSNIFLGQGAGANATTGSNNIIIGAGLNVSAAGVSNELNLGGVLQGNTSSLAASFAGTLAITTLGTADTSTFLCRNSSSIIATCTYTPLSSSLTDNTTDALDIQEGTNNYININTTNSSENISFGNATTNPSYSFLGSGTLTVAGNTTLTADLAVNGGDITSTGDLIITPAGGDTTVTGTLTSTGLLTGQAGATISGAITSLNASSNFNTNINTGTSTGTVAIGNSASTTTVLGTTTINTTGTATTGIGNSGAVTTINGSSILLNTATLSRTAAGTTSLDLVDGSATTFALLNSGAGVANLTVDGSITVGTLGTTDNASFLCRNTSNILAGCNYTPLNPTLTDNTTDALDIQEGTNNYININTTNSSENISFGNATTNPSYSFLGSGTLSVAGAETVSGLLTANLGATISGATTSINASSNFNTNINTGTSTGAVSIGNSAAGAIALQSASTIGITGTTTITGLGGGSTKALEVNNSTSTGNIFEAQDNGTAVFTVADGGAVLAKNTTNSTTGFQVQPSGSTTPVLDVDTSNSRVGIGTNAPSVELHVMGTARFESTGNSRGLEIAPSSSGVDFNYYGSMAGTGNAAFDFNTGGAQAVQYPTVRVNGGQTTAGVATLAVNSTGTADIFQVQDSGTPVFTVTDGGNTTLTADLAVNGGDITSTGDLIITPAGGDTTVTGTLTSTGLLTGQAGATVGGGAIALTGNAASSFTTSSGALTLTSAAAATWSTSSGALTVDSAAALNLGTTAATSVSIGRTGVTTTNKGALTVTQLLTGNLGATVSGAAISLNDNSNFATTINTGTSTGNVTIGNSSNAANTITLVAGATNGIKLQSSNITLGASAGSGTFTNNGSTKNTVSALGDLAAGALGTAAATVDVYTSFTISPTASGRTYTIPAPTDGAAGRTIYISNINATNTFIIGSTTFGTHSTATMVYDGSGWNFAGMDGGSNNYIQNQTAVDQTASYRIAGSGQITQASNASALSVTANAITTANAVAITSTGTGLTTGSLLSVSTATTGAVATNGAVSIQATGNYTSTSNVGILSLQANSTTAGTVQNISANALTTGQALYVSSTSTGLTSGSLAYFTSATTGAVATNGIVSLNATGNYTSTSNAGLLNVAANSTTAGTVANFSANALTTGVGVNVASTGTGLTSGSLLNVTSATTGAVATNGIVSLNATGNYTSSSNVGLLSVNANSTTAGTIANFSGNALTTGVGVRIASTSTGLTSGSLLQVSTATTGAVATNGAVQLTASGNYTSTSNVGLLSVQANSTTAGTIQNINGNALTTGVGLYLGSTSTGITSGSLLYGTTATTGAVATNGIFSLNATGNYTSTSNAGLLNVAANSTTAGTVANISGTALTTGTALNITASSLTTGAALNITANSTANAIKAAGNIQFAELTGTRTLGVETRTTSATAGTSLTVQAGSASTSGAATAGGTLTLQGGSANGASSGANGGNVVIAGGTGYGTGVKGLIVMDTTAYSAAAVQNFTASAGITQANVDTYGSLLISGNAAGRIATLPDPTTTTTGRVLYITNSGSYDITLAANTVGVALSITLKPASTATMYWNGTDWTAAGASSSTDLQAAYNNTATSAGNAEIVLSSSGTGGLTIRNDATTAITGGLLEVQTSIGSNLFTVNNNATEYANNGGAESSTFTMWTAHGTGPVISRYTTTGNNIATGVGSVYVDTTSTANTGVKNTLTSTLTANLKYKVSYTVRHTSSTTTFTTLDTYFSSDGTTASTSCATGSTATYNQWTRIDCTFTPTSVGASNAILIRHSDAVEHDFYIDNLSVTVSADANHAVDGDVDSALGSNWQAYDADGGAGTSTATRDTTNIYNTSGAVAVATTAGSAEGEGVRNNMSITPTVSTQYLVTFYAKSTTAFSDIKVGFLPAGGSSTPVSAQLCADYNTRTVSTTGWTKITCVFTTPSSGISDPDLVIYQGSAAARTFYVDALRITLNTNNSSNVQVGGGQKGGPTTLFTLDRSYGAPIADNNDAYLGSMYYDTSSGRIQCYEADGWGACGAAPDNYVNLNPEYAGAVLHGSGVGTMTADFCSNQSGVLQVNYATSTDPCYTSGDVKNYYKWTSPQSTQQTYSIYVTYQLPATFNGFSSDDTVQLQARVDNTTNASVTYEMFYRASGAGSLTQCGSGETNVITGGGGSANTWYSYGINGNEATGCSLSSSYANGLVIFKINMKANSNASAYVSTLSFTTTGR